MRQFLFLLFIPLIIFSLLLLPFINTEPCWDASREFTRTETLYKQGLIAYSKLPAAHPPFRAFLVSMLYKIKGGPTPVVDNFVGLVAGFGAILGIYVLCFYLFDKRVALIAALLLSTFPLFLANSINLHTDYLATVLILLAAYCYVRKKFFLYSALASFAVLTKETVLLFPISVVFIELLFFIKNRKHKKYSLIHALYFVLPLVVYFSWIAYVGSSNITQGYSGYIRSETGSQGPFVTVLHNVLTLDFFHEYAKQHLGKLIFLNFAWVYWTVIIVGAIPYITAIRRHKLQILTSLDEQKLKTFLIIALFSVSFIVTVLTLQISSAARYQLPLVPFVLIACSFIITKYIPKIPVSVILLFSLIIFVRLYYSLDPLSVILWDKESISGQSMYTKSSGDDALVYNLQYLLILKKRKLEIARQLPDIHTDLFHSKLCSFRD